MKEVWRKLKYKDIINRYEISNKGRIRNIETDKYLTGTLSHNGYVRVKLKDKHGNRKQYPLHRLVLLHFGVFRKPTKPTVNHKDGNKLNNDIRNLEWMDFSEQQLHSIKIGLRKLGEENAKSVYSNDFVHTICKLLEQGITKPGAIAHILDIENDSSFSSLVKNIRLKYTWKHISCNYNI